MGYTRNVVYSDGNAKVWEPRALTLGNNPAFGIMFQDNVNVIFLFPLQKQNIYIQTIDLTFTNLLMKI